MDYSRRLKGLQTRMEELDIGLVVYGSSPNFQYLTGTVADWRRGEGHMRTRMCHLFDEERGRVNVFIPREGEPILTFAAPARVGLVDASPDHLPPSWIKDTRVLERGEKYGDMIRKAVSDLGVPGGKTGLGDNVGTTTLLEVVKAVKGSEVVSAENLMDDLRMIKEAEEIERLRNVAELSRDVIDEMIPRLREGMRTQEISLEIEMTARRLGAQDASFPATIITVVSGSEPAADPLASSSEEGLKRGTSIAFDIGFILDGYCSDCGTSVYFGRASGEAKKGYETLQRGMVETVDEMYDGSMRVSDVFPKIVEPLNRVGLGKYLRTLTPGHQIGVEVHEPPWLKPGENEPLRSGMVMCPEPKLYHAGEYYLRIEDMVLVKKDKSEFLTKFDRELLEV